MIVAGIRFTGNMSAGLVFLIAIVAAIGVLLYYLRETRHLDAPARYLLPGLRATAIAVAILTLTGPVWHRSVTVGTLGRVVFAVDVSESMSVNDSEGDPDSPDRLRRAVTLLAGEGEQLGWVEMLSQTHDVEVIAFSSGSPTVVSLPNKQAETRPRGRQAKQTSGKPSLETLIAESAYTDLASAIKSSVTSMSPLLAGDRSPNPKQEAEDVQRGAIVLFSDGRDNVGDSPVDASKRASALGVSVFTIGMGREDESMDVGITAVEHPANVAAEGSMSGEIDLHLFGVEGRRLNVQIETADGEVVWSELVTASQGMRMSVPFELDVESLVSRIGSNTPRGISRSSVVLDLRARVSLGGSDSLDTNSRNDSKPFRVAASTRDRRLLILDGSSRWETRYLRNLFARDPSWKVDTVLFGPGTDEPRLIRGERPGLFPANANAIGRYDAIVMGEIPSNQFESFDGDLIRQFVSRGGGLIVVDGGYDQIRRIASSDFGELLPVSYPGKSIIKVKMIRPTRAGVDQPLMSLTSDREESAEFWEALPPPASANRVHPKPGAEVWGEVVDDQGVSSPWLSTSLFGSGRVFHLSSDQTWRWRYKVADRIHARFWNQLLTAVMQPPYSASDDYVSIGTDKIEYDNGEPTVIRARVQGPNGKPISDATVDALVIRENQTVATIPLAIDDPNRGSYRGEAVFSESGKYDIRIRASGFDTRSLQASTPVWVFPKDSAEWNRISLDRKTMELIAKHGNGEYFHESSSASVLDQLRPLSSGQTMESEFLLWQSYYWFIAIIGLLTAEWYLRKRSGLV